jgi:hypothetical protein
LPKDENGKILYTEVIQADSIKMNQLYLNSKQFFVDAFKSAKDVIQLDDKEAGIVIGKGFSDIYIKSLGLNVKTQMWYTIKIQSKDGRYKYDIYDIYFKNYPSQYASSHESPAEEQFQKSIYYKKDGTPKEFPLKYKNAMEDNIKSTVELIKTIMSKSVIINDKKSDW